jgi:hypothetical protein
MIDGGHLPGDGIAATAKSERCGRVALAPFGNAVAATLQRVSHGLAVRAAREAAARERIREGHPPGDSDARAQRSLASGPRPVLNATGVIVHTNLGRAPLAERAPRAAVEAAVGYSDVEYDLEGGGRGRRQTHVDRQAIDADTAALIWAHSSNFRVLDPRTLTDDEARAAATAVVAALA